MQFTTQAGFTMQRSKSLTQEISRTNTTSSTQETSRTDTQSSSYGYHKGGSVGAGISASYQGIGASLSGSVTAGN